MLSCVDLQIQNDVVLPVLINAPIVGGVSTTACIHMQTCDTMLVMLFLVTYTSHLYQCWMQISQVQMLN